MAYQALYRTWRPQKFSDMIGQEVVTKTLKNAIITGQTTHAYLFNGPRGTGKTSAAKIFAKAINCLHPVDGEPDGTCEICQAMDAGTLGDVIELDAASNNGVDEIREIREDVTYAPTQAKYKVYIIDEVHMLSTGAFNALLKTLEEPPANVIFILATTEPQKIPATIISRTQRFDFKRINAQAAFDRMVYILNERGNTYDEAALHVIANAADGGMRDALSILDQALSFGDGHVTLENALLVTGSVTQTLLGQYVQAVVQQDTKAALAKLAEVLDAGKDANRFVEDLISYARDLLLYTQAPELVTLVPDEVFMQLAQEQAALLWYNMIDQLNETQQQLRFTNRPAIYLEVLTVKLSQPITTVVQHTSMTPDSKKQPIKTAATKTVEQAPVEAESEPTTEPKTDKISHKPAVTVHVSEDQTSVFKVLAEATRGDLNRITAVWADMVNMLPVSEQAMLNVSRPVAASASGLVVAFNFDIIRHNAMQKNDLLQTMVTQIRELTQAANERQLVFITSDDWQQLRAKYVAQLPNQHTQAQPIPDEMATQISDEPAIDQPVEQADNLITEAKNIFDEALVEEVDD